MFIRTLKLKLALFTAAIINREYWLKNTFAVILLQLKEVVNIAYPHNNDHHNNNTFSHNAVS